METTAPPDSRKQRRCELADTYFNEDLNKQHNWYDKQASLQKKWANRLSLTVIAFGALTSSVAGLEPTGFNYNILIAVLGVLVVIAQGILRIWRYDETWVEYRMASERMLRERRLFINAVGPYADIADEEESLRYFIEATEQIIAAEQKVYFKQDHDTLQRRSEIQQAGSPPPAESTTTQSQHSVRTGT
ncbi:DUF4231 domain-containing protein [Candidatus Entotheonella palauensis]|uniref:DUF4231 domain-containing protein n=1 Tax=Candidatus Entotheonella palauensis TaxID=93172 RepID=UPI000B7E5D9F|nr:DUF4231 domain-containing protein [Candidatus Entotheonella palauensis]